MATKGTYPFDLEAYKQFKEQLRDLDGRALDGQVDIDRARQLLQVAVRDQFDSVQFVDPFFRYAHLLLSLEDQLKLIDRFNTELWDHALTDDQFAAIATASNHAQAFGNIEVLHVELGSPMETFEAWAKVLQASHPNFWRGNSINPGYKIRLLRGNTVKYESGIHRVCLDLGAHWEPENGRTVDEVRIQAKAAKEKLAHGEGLSAYGLHSDLLQKTDGTNLPYPDLAGYEVKASGDSEWRDAPYLDWDAGDRKANLNSDWTDDRYQYDSAPVVRES